MGAATRQAKITPLPAQTALEKLFKLSEVADYLQVGIKEVYRLIIEICRYRGKSRQIRSRQMLSKMLYHSRAYLHKRGRKAMSWLVGAFLLFAIAVVCLLAALRLKGDESE